MIINKDEHFYEDNKKLILTQEELNFIENKTINVSASNNWDPFTFLSNNNKNVKLTGISSEIWQLVVNKLDLKN